MTKYREYFQRMIDNNKQLFDEFQKIHDDYQLSPDKNQLILNREGEKVLAIIREWENKLCMQSEKGGYAKFTTGLSEKFWGEVRKQFPKIDFIGIIPQNTNKNSSLDQKPVFNVKKIEVNSY